VVVNVTDEEAEDDARRRLAAAGADLARVRFHRVPLDDAWFRDNGPTFVVDGYARVAATDWRFNAWGGKYAFARDDRAPEAVARDLGMRRFAFDYVLEGGAIEVNDEGMLITTRSCLLTPTRNPLLDEADTEALLRAGLGVRHVIWLDEGLEGDHTDGHVDTIVRFAGDRTIVCAVTDDENDANFAPMQRNLAALRALTDPDGPAVPRRRAAAAEGAAGAGRPPPGRQLRQLVRGERRRRRAHLRRRPTTRAPSTSCARSSPTARWSGSRPAR
jgi:agmatine deiminase